MEVQIDHEHAQEWASTRKAAQHLEAADLGAAASVLLDALHESARFPKIAALDDCARAVVGTNTMSERTLKHLLLPRLT
jgi:hypothetical protein